MFDDGPTCEIPDRTLVELIHETIPELEELALVEEGDDAVPSGIDDDETTARMLINPRMLDALAVLSG